MNIVLTNDDGIDAPGISALQDACGHAGEVIVVAPHGPQSGVGHRVTVEHPLRVDEEAACRFRVHGTPADCSRVALTELVPAADWVLAGVNRGGNLGSDSYMSGTIAAAREAALLGKRAIAISQYVGKQREVDWELTAARTRRVLELLMSEDYDDAFFWSVNLPHPDSDDVDLECVRCDLDPSPHGVAYSRDGAEFIYEADYHERPRLPNHDVDICFGGRIALTRIPILLRGN